MRGSIAAIFAAMLIPALGGCALTTGGAGVSWAALDPGPTPDRKVALEEARSAILLRLKDPDSAQFRKTTPFFKTLDSYAMSPAGSPLWAMCLEVNAKNSYGGYGGYEYWLVRFRNGHIIAGGQGVSAEAAYECASGLTQNGRLANS